MNNNLIDSKICIICLENEDDLENNKLIEYNHCGIYYVHLSCLNSWTHSECLICREKMYIIHNNNESENVTIESNTNSNSPLVVISNTHEPYNVIRENKCHACMYKIIIGLEILGICSMLLWTLYNY